MSDENDKLQEWIDPELEARVVAWVLGEASEFEAAELARIVAEKPELGIFKRRIEAVHGLVQAASRSEADPMRLDNERRRKLLETIGQKEASTAQKVIAMPQEKTIARWKIAVGIAACVMVVGFLASTSMPSFYGYTAGSAATHKQEQQKLADATTAPQQTEEAPPAGNSENFGVQAPTPGAEPQRLLALESLKQLAQQQKEAEEGGAVPASPNVPGADNLHYAVSGLAPAARGGIDEKSVDLGMKAGRFIAASGGTTIANSATETAEPASLPVEVPAPTTDNFGAFALNKPGGGEVSRALNGVNSFTGDTTVNSGSTVAPPASAGSMAAPGGGEQVLAAQADTDIKASGDSISTGHEYAETRSTLLFQLDNSRKMPASEAAAKSTEAASVAQTLDFNSGTLTAQSAPLGNTISNVAVLGDMPMLNGLRAQGPQSASYLGEVSATDQPYSTFSLHVSDVSFQLARVALEQGQTPDPDSIHPEEFYNAFDYGDPAPGPNEKIACRIEQAAHPILQQRNLVRIAMKVAATGRGAGQPLRLTVLLDTSGSMEREDRAASVQRAFQVLTSLLGPKDAITLIGFARQPRLLAEEVPGDQAGKLVDIVKHTPADGGTNMEEAIKLASELALRHFEAGGQNRVVMLTDGAANLGDASPDQLSKLVGQLRQKGVSFDACGVGASGLDDDMLEALTRKGGGRYYFLNQPEDADEGFARQLAGAFRPAAENVKMQVRFNSARVGNYRLIGFEKHRLNQEDFRNDKVTAAQLAAEEAGVALYQVQVLPEGEGEVGEVFVRFRDPSSGQMVEQSWTIPYDAQAPALDKASPSMQLAATASLLAEKLRGGPIAAAVDLDALAPIVTQVHSHYAAQPRVQDLVTMFNQTRRMSANNKQN